MKQVANSHHRDVSYSVGYWVYVCLRPYRQTSLRSSYSKLPKRLYGPFGIQELGIPGAYQLQLSDSTRIHLVFDVSLLKPHHSSFPVTVDTIYPANSDNHSVIEPLSILDWKWDTTTIPASKLVLVQWLGLPPEDTTLEHWGTLSTIHNLEGKIVFPGKGVDSNIGQTHSRPKRTSKKPNYFQGLRVASLQQLKNIPSVIGYDQLLIVSPIPLCCC